MFLPMFQAPQSPEAGPPASRSALSTASEQGLRLIFRLLAWSFAGVGAIFFCFPNGTVRFINATGALFGIFTPAPQSDLRFWLSLGVSYMLLVTLLAYWIQKAPYSQRHLMPLLAAGKACSSLTCLFFFLVSAPAFLYLLNFLVDGSIALLVLGCYAWTGVFAQPAEGRDRLVARSRPILDAVVDTLFPAGGAFQIAGRDTRLGSDLWEYSRQIHTHGPVGLALLLRAIEYGPYLFGPTRARFTRLSAEDRSVYLSGFESSRLAARRQLIAGIKLIAMLHFYGYPQVQGEIGYDGGYLSRKLLAGPNAAHHRQRLQ